MQNLRTDLRQTKGEKNKTKKHVGEEQKQHLPSLLDGKERSEEGKHRSSGFEGRARPQTRLVFLTSGAHPALRTSSATTFHPEGNRAPHSHRSPFRYVPFHFIYLSLNTPDVFLFKKSKQNNSARFPPCAPILILIRSLLIEPKDAAFIWLPYPWAMQHSLHTHPACSF